VRLEPLSPRHAEGLGAAGDQDRASYAFTWVPTATEAAGYIETQLERERAALSACAEHADGAEGLRAFSEKRKPHFTSR